MELDDSLIEDSDSVSLDEILTRELTELDIYRDHDVAEIVPGLFLGSCDVAEDIDFLRRVNIITIIRITEEPPPGAKLMGSYNGTEIVVYKNENVFIYHISKQDSKHEIMSNVFEEVATIIDDGLEFGVSSVLVHCHMGISRSSTMVIAWLMHHGKSFDQAYRIVKFWRSIICPNDGFIKQLKAYIPKLC